MGLLDDLTATLDRRCADLLGDTIEYAADGSTFVEVQAYVDYRDGVVELAGAEAVAQDIVVTGLLKADVPTEPSKNARIRLPRRPGQTWRPIDVRTDESGTGWDFELAEVKGG